MHTATAAAPRIPASYTGSRLAELAPFAAPTRMRGVWSATVAAVLMGGLCGNPQATADARNGVDPDAEPRTAKRAKVLAKPTLGDFVQAAKAHGATAILAGTVDGAVYDVLAVDPDHQAAPEVPHALDPADEPIGLDNGQGAYLPEDDNGPDVDSPEAREAQAAAENKLEAALVAVMPEPSPEPEVAPVKPSRFAATGKRGQRLGEGVITLEHARERLAQLKAAPYAADHLVGLWTAKVAELEALAT